MRSGSRGRLSVKAERKKKTRIEVNWKISEEPPSEINRRVRNGNKYELIEFAFAYRNSRDPRPTLRHGASAGVELLFRFVRTSANINIPTLDLIAQNGF